MLRARRFRHGAHHVNRFGLSGSNRRPRSTRGAPRSVRKRALFGALSHTREFPAPWEHVHFWSVRCSCLAQHQVAPFRVPVVPSRRRAWSRSRVWRDSLSPVRHVDRCETRLPCSTWTMARFHVERGWLKTDRPRTDPSARAETRPRYPFSVCRRRGMAGSLDSAGICAAVASAPAGTPRRGRSRWSHSDSCAARAESR